MPNENYYTYSTEIQVPVGQIHEIYCDKYGSLCFWKNLSLRQIQVVQIYFDTYLYNLFFLIIADIIPPKITVQEYYNLTGRKMPGEKKEKKEKEKAEEVEEIEDADEVENKEEEKEEQWNYDWKYGVHFFIRIWCIKA